MTMRGSGDGVDVFEAGSTLTKIHSFDFSRLSYTSIGSFSPNTHRVSISGRNELRILDIQNSKLLLDETGKYSSPFHCFSSDGSLFAASQSRSVHVWKYASGCYTLWRTFQCQGRPDFLQFSPTPSSILGGSKTILQVWRLHELPSTPKTDDVQFMELSRSGTRLATAHELGNTVTIIYLAAQSPPQLIDTDVEIKGLFLTGNVLLVAGSTEIIAWLLTEEGLVDGVTGDRRAGRSDSIWTTPNYSQMPKVGDGAGVIELHGGAVHVYDTDTGEVLDPTRAPRHYVNYWHNNKIPWCDIPFDDRWKTSRDTLREGWVKDPEGKCRMWVPVEWRKDWRPSGWDHDITTQFSRIGGRFVLVRF